MKKCLSVLLSALLALTLCACGGSKDPSPKDFSPEAAGELVGSGAFSEDLLEIDGEVACALCGLDADKVTGCAMYGSTGTTAEQLFLLTLSDEAAAQDAVTSLGYYLEDRLDSMTTYMPQEVPKLQEAILERRGCTILLAVCSDYGPIRAYLEQ